MRMVNNRLRVMSMKSFSGPWLRLSSKPYKYSSDSQVVSTRKGGI